MHDLIITLDSQGHITIPETIRQELGLSGGDHFIAYVEAPNQIILAKLPTADDWDALLEDIPVESVPLDQAGHYDPEKSPQFHAWMHEDD